MAKNKKGFFPYNLQQYYFFVGKLRGFGLFTHDISLHSQIWVGSMVDIIK